MTVYWERAAGIKNYLRMKGLEQRGSSIPPMFDKLTGDLARDIEKARKEYPVDFAPEIELYLHPGVVHQMKEEVQAALDDRCERIWVILSDATREGERLLLKAKELVTFKELQKHVGDVKRNGSSIDAKRIVFYFAHLPIKGVWALVHSHVDAAPFPTGPDISHLPLGWIGITASVWNGRFYIIPYRSDSYEYKGTAPSREYFRTFVLNLKGQKHRGWYEAELPQQ
ncbi:MAG: hypothetical protein FJ149_08580 [Euryarchaeota archaeon]|nr:hypothetical protein [Euryarchaeota archaeon]